MDIYGNVSENYMKWLSKIVGGTNNRAILMLHLLGIEFYSEEHEFDKNRISDAMLLRRLYLSEKDIPTNLFENEPPTVLEILIGLVKRVEDDILCEEDNLSAQTIFEMFLTNMEIDFLYDWSWGFESELYVRRRVEIFLDRTYERDGSNGNIFVVKNLPDNVDFRKKDIWSQLQWWLRDQMLWGV